MSLTLCVTPTLDGNIKGKSQTSGLIHHLVSKHGLERERSSTSASLGERAGGVEEEKQKGLLAGPPALLMRGSCHQDTAQMPHSQKTVMGSQPQAGMHSCY